MTVSQALFRCLVGVFLSFSLLFLDTIGWATWIRGGVEFVMKPELRMISKLSQGAGGIFESVKFVFSEKDRVTELEKELTKAQQLLVETKGVQRENEQLKNALGSKILPQKFHLTPAKVFSNGPIVMIENINFSPSQIVLSPEGGLVGSIERVGIFGARIRLPTDANNKIEVSVLTADGKKTNGELHGVFGSSMTVEKVIGDFQLSPGQLVVTKGDQDTMVPDILVGRIGTSIQHEESAVYQNAVVEPAVNVTALSTVLVIEQK